MLVTSKLDVMYKNMKEGKGEIVLDWRVVVILTHLEVSSHSTSDHIGNTPFGKFATLDKVDKSVSPEGVVGVL